MSTYTHKVVNGQSVELTPEEIAYLEARDAAWIPEDREDTAAQIDDYFAANVTDTAQAIEHLKAVCKILGLKVLPRV